MPKARISIASTIRASLTMLRSSRAFGGLVPSKSRWLSAEPVDVADTDLASVPAMLLSQEQPHATVQLRSGTPRY